jgi:hypothetical protein
MTWHIRRPVNESNGNSRVAMQRIASIGKVLAGSLEGEEPRMCLGLTY